MMRLQKNYQFLIIVFAVSLLQACAINDKQQKQLIDSGQELLKGLNKKSLTEQDIAAGLKEALKIGSERVVAQVGKKNGYLNDKNIHIALPAKLQKVHKALDKLGLGQYTKELEIKMNRAAEVAAPKAKKLFFSAIKTMRWQDIKAIYNGKNDAATQYFKKKMTPSLKRMMKPLITQTLAETGFYQAYKHVLKQYHSIPFVPKVKDDLTGYVMAKGINGMFYYLAKEETAIRKDPVKQTTALLKKVFGK